MGSGTVHDGHHGKYPSLASLGLSFFTGKIKIIPPALLIRQIVTEPRTMNAKMYSPDRVHGL